MKKRTGRMWVVSAILLIVGALYAYAAVTPYVGEHTTEITTSTSFTVTIDSTVSQLDSLDIIGFVGDATDTTWFASIDTATTDTTITGLVPGERYRIYIYGRGSGLTDISSPDTLRLYYPQMGDRTRTGLLNRKLQTAASWPQTNSNDYIFDLDDTGAKDSTLVYYGKTYNGMDVLASQAADSCVATIYAMPLQWSGIWSDTLWTRGLTVADSINITAAGLTRHTLSLPVGKYYFFRIETLYGNGQNADYTLTLTSDGHE